VIFQGLRSIINGEGEGEGHVWITRREIYIDVGGYAEESGIKVAEVAAVAE